MWWGMITLTTVGYGDVYPVTLAGRILGGVIAMLGIGVFALPAGLLGSAFVEELQRERRGKINCPHCGGEFPLDRSPPF
jgi:voltage-gated potassium channel